jgi:isopenicillin N synthase-like dioxygenase
MIELARQFFDLPAEEKDRIHIRHSQHFRGYSEMKNSRDWREQIHFGAEHQAPNQWPSALGSTWQQQVLEFLETARREGERIMQELGLPVAPDPYLLLKMICYHPQPDPDRVRPGVAAHCDWSWITLLYQDEVGGLQEQQADGTWSDVTAPFSVTIGEIAEIATGGRLRARPHRVVNRSVTQRRISIPVFICPPLDAWIEGTDHCYQEAGEHIHRVRNPAAPFSRFRFGDSEFKRKDLGQWCWREACVSADKMKSQ